MLRKLFRIILIYQDYRGFLTDIVIIKTRWEILLNPRIEIFLVYYLDYNPYTLYI